MCFCWLNMLLHWKREYTAAGRWKQCRRFYVSDHWLKACNTNATCCLSFVVFLKHEQRNIFLVHVSVLLQNLSLVNRLSVLTTYFYTTDSKFLIEKIRKNFLCNYYSLALYVHVCFFNISVLCLYCNKHSDSCYYNFGNQTQTIIFVCMYIVY